MALECFEIKTEADSSDISECSDDDKPSTSTGTFVCCLCSRRSSFVMVIY